MNSADEFAATHRNNYQFPPWSNAVHRPPSSTSNEFPPLSIDNRSSSPDATKTPKKKIIRHHVRMPTFSRISSPVLLAQRPITPDLLSTHFDQTVLISLEEHHRSTPVTLKSAEVKLQTTTTRKSKHFPKQTFEHSQLTFERKKRKQQAQFFVDQPSPNESWFQLRKSLSEFKRFAGRETTLSLPAASEPKKLRSSRIYMDPLLVAAKPIHPVFCSSSKPREKSARTRPTTPTSRLRSRLPSSLSRRSSPEKRRQFLSSELSESDRVVTPSPRRVVSAAAVPLVPRLPSSIELHRKTEFLPMPPIRSRSANDIKTGPSTPRFVIVADEEHRIESWFHHYPFVLADELLKLFRAKNASKTSLAGYFIDEFHTLNPNSTAKTFFQGKPFHIHHDWKKFDLIFVSKPVAEEIVAHLQTIFHSLKALRRPIPIYQVDHQKELRKQIKSQCRAFQLQQNEK